MVTPAVATESEASGGPGWGAATGVVCGWCTHHITRSFPGRSGLWKPRSWGRGCVDRSHLQLLWKVTGRLHRGQSYCGCHTARRLSRGLWRRSAPWLVTGSGWLDQSLVLAKRDCSPRAQWGLDASTATDISPGPGSRSQTEEAWLCLREHAAPVAGVCGDAPKPAWETGRGWFSYHPSPCSL